MFYTYYADTLVTLMLGWIRGFTDWIWKLISMSGSSAGSGFLGWFSENWLRLVVVLILVGIAVDWLIWLIRWRPYWLWFGKKRRILDDTDEESEVVRRSSKGASEASVQRPRAPHFTSTALPRAEVAHPEEDFEEDDLFDVVSSSIPEPKAPTQQTLVGVAVNQYIDNRASVSGQAESAKTQKKEIEWFD